MEQTKLKQLIFKILKTDDRLWSKDKPDSLTKRSGRTELNQTLLLDLVEKIDEKIIGSLLQEKNLRKKFFCENKRCLCL